MGKQVKLVAKERIQYAAGEFAEPGDTFETTEGSAAQLIELGHATDPSSTAPSATRSAKSGPLPADFPGRDKLKDAGINTYAQARAADLMQISGIGDATADKINEALEA